MQVMLLNSFSTLATHTFFYFCNANISLLNGGMIHFCLGISPVVLSVVDIELNWDASFRRSLVSLLAA